MIEIGGNGRPLRAPTLCRFVDFGAAPQAFAVTSERKKAVEPCQSHYVDRRAWAGFLRLPFMKKGSQAFGRP
jgi:hypothetical protein